MDKNKHNITTVVYCLLLCIVYYYAFHFNLDCLGNVPFTAPCQSLFLKPIKNSTLHNIGSYGCIMKHGHVMKHFGLSCVPPVKFLRKSTEFHNMRAECQRILIYFLLLISHNLLAIAKCFPLPYSLADLHSPIYIAIANQLMVYINRRS